MWITWFMTEVPPWVRLLLAEILTIGITLTVIAVFHERIVALAAGRPWPPVPESGTEPDSGTEPESGTDGKDDAPEPFNLAGRIMSITATAFVFLLAFALNNFEGRSEDARAAFESEVSAQQAAVFAADHLAGTAPNKALAAALRAYGRSVADDEWPLLRASDGSGVQALHNRNRSAVAAAVVAAAESGAAKSPSWAALDAAVTDMLAQGQERIDQLPRPSAPGILMLIFILGVTNLAVTAAFQPAPLATNLVLMGLMSAIVALMLYIVAEAANPYTGGPAVLPIGYMT